MSSNDREAVLAELTVSRETSARLDSFVELLTKWNAAINLVAKSTLCDAWSRHILDSAQILSFAPEDARRWADLGSGGGLPGLVIAILAAEKRPDLKVTLVESDQRKAAFLREAVRQLELNTTTCAERIENLPPLGAQVVSARALAPLKTLLGYARRHLAQGGVAIFPKGAGHEAELAESLERWRFSVQKHPSRTDPNAVLLCIGDIALA